MNIISVLASRAWISLTTLPTDQAAWNVVAVTAVTTFGAGAVAIGTGFIEPVQDFNPPSIASLQAEPASMLPLLKPLSAFIFPSLLEELFWRGMILSPPPTSHLTSLPAPWLIEAGIVLVVHVATHPLAGRTVWPRGRKTFEDYRFLGLASIVLAGATVSYVVSGGSVWAAAFTHGVPVALWRDFFGGEAKLLQNSAKLNID
ncbi:CAAX protease self-immunity-domain containing protein [Nitzschia inconspicua]|uniref:CAAX protease self-immunity-domain containing protein n=1 Tax=Nitzschia inconspicua TaxID=303405 RepID=A0A9K3KUM4_9STRA|nr:CAAX protease self-immunity-domain containing protein [Nitzschia inconspicua]